MPVTTSYPGVYIEEFAPAPPIQGLSTSVAAFLGPAATGPILAPTLITSWDDFKRIFGAQPLPGFFLWYAVRGFFENSGQLAYIVRISNGVAASLPLPDRSPGAPPRPPALVVTALTPGAAGDSITVKVDETQALNHVFAFRHDPAILAAAGTAVTFNTPNDAVRFRPGDNVIVDGDPAHRAQVLSIDTQNAIVTLSQVLPQAGPGHNLRLDSLSAALLDRVVRVQVPAPDNPVDLAAGTVLVLDNTVNTDTLMVESVALEMITLPSPPLAPVTTYRVTFRQPVTHDYGLATGDPPLNLTSREFDLTVVNGPSTEPYTHLSVDPVHPHYFGAVVNTQSHLVSLQTPTPPETSGPPDYLPATLATTNLQTGSDEVLRNLLPSNYQTGLDTLVNIDANIVAIPDRQDVAVQSALLDHCQGAPPKVGNRFAILDSQQGAPMSGPGSVSNQIAPIAGNGLGFAALYYPWIVVPPAPPAPGGPPPVVKPANITMPPSGHVAGVYARTDNSRGVHKAPAGIEAGLFGTLALERVLGDTEQGFLNMPPYGINVIRSFRGGLPTIWGARTNAVAAGNANWQYVNVRRLFLFLEASITAGIRFAVFEPNTADLWGKLKRSISAFLTKVWRDGALYGTTAKDAFYVRIDDVLNPPEQRKLGYLTIEIGVCPAYPAEFIVVRIGIWDGGSTITEV
jgi:hypothetical protein